MGSKYYKEINVGCNRRNVKVFGVRKYKGVYFKSKKFLFIGFFWVKGSLRDDFIFE